MYKIKPEKSLWSKISYHNKEGGKVMLNIVGTINDAPYDTQVRIMLKNIIKYIESNSTDKVERILITITKGK